MTAVASSNSYATLLGSGSNNQLGIWVTSGGETSFTAPAYAMDSIGSIIKVDLFGTWGSTNAQPTLQFEIKFKTVAIVTNTAAAVSAANAVTTGIWYASMAIVTASTGSSGTVTGYLSPVMGISFGTNTPSFTCQAAQATSGAIDLTATAAFDFGVIWGTSNGSNTISVTAGQATYIPGPYL
jgi:hypothetical protein